MLAGINSIGLNFVGGRADTAEPDGHARTTASSTAVAGVPGVAQSNWNNLAGPTGTAAAGSLARQERRSRSPAPTSTWASNNLWTIRDRRPPPTGCRTDEGLSRHERHQDHDRDGLRHPADMAEYDVYVYLDGDANAGRAGNYTIIHRPTGPTRHRLGHRQLELATAAGGTFTRANENAHESPQARLHAGNYLVFPGCTT